MPNGCKLQYFIARFFKKNSDDLSQAYTKISLERHLGQVSTTVPVVHRSTKILHTCRTALKKQVLPRFARPWTTHMNLVH